MFVSLEWAEKVPNEIGAIALEQDGIPAASHDGVAQLQPGKRGLANFSSLAGSGMFFSRIPDPKISHPGSTIVTAPDLQHRLFFTQKIVSKLSEI